MILQVKLTYSYGIIDTIEFTLEKAVTERETRVMNVQNIYDTVADMKKQIHAELSHPYVQKFIHHPTVDENKLLYVCSFLTTLSLEQQKWSRCALSVMLVQTALDTHDLVSTQNVDSEGKQLHERQLTVLAGDYYSGLYYYYLAQTGQIDLIKVIASSIKEINIAKIHIYHNHTKDLQDMMTNFFTVESSLISSLCDYFNCSEWQELLEHACRLNAISTQLTKLEQHEPSILLDSYEKNGMESTRIQEALYASSESSIAVVKQYLAAGSIDINEPLKKHLYEMTGSLERLKNVVGEG